MTVAGHGSLCTSVSPLVQGTFFSFFSSDRRVVAEGSCPGKGKGGPGGSSGWSFIVLLGARGSTSWLRGRLWEQSQGRLLGGGELSVGTRGGWRSLRKVRLGVGARGCLHAPRPAGHLPQSAPQQAWKPCRAGWGSGEGGRVYHSTHQLSHGARPTGPPLRLAQPALTGSPLCASHGVRGSTARQARALGPGFQP